MTEDDKLPCKGKFCRRPGLPFLPLRVAYVPNGLQALPDPIMQSDYADGVYTHLTGMTDEPKKLMLRTITEGYVYIHDPNQADSPWRCYAATPDGHFKEIIVADGEQPAKQPTFCCSRVGDNIEASLLSIENAKHADKYVWVGYSRVWWTKKTRGEIAKNQKLRDTYMVTVDAKALYEGTEASEPFMLSTAFRLDKTGAKLKQHVLEYRPDHTAALKAAAETSNKKLEFRTDDAEPLAARMYERSHQHGGVVLALPDIIGLAKDTGCWRNQCAGKLADYQVNQAKFRPKIVRDIVLGIKQNMQDNGQAEEWADRYASKLDMGRLLADEAAEKQKVQNYTFAIYRASYDWRTVVSRKPFEMAWQAYDGKDRACGMALEHDFAGCVEGSGAVEEEKKWWLNGFLAQSKDQQNPLWLALGAGDADLVGKLFAVTGKGIDLYRNAKDGLEGFKDWLEKRRTQGALRPATEDTGAIAGVVVALAPAEMATDASGFEVIGARLRIIICARTDVFLSPTTFQATTTQMVVASYETAWGPPTASMTTRVLRARSTLITQDVGGGFVGGQFQDATTMEVNMWLPQADAARLEHAAANGLLDARSAEGALTGNPYNAVRELAQSVDGKLMGLLGALALWDLSSALHSLQKAEHETGTKGASDRTAARYGVVSGTLAVSAIVSEAYGKAKALRVSSEVATAIKAKVAGDVAKSVAEDAAAKVIASAALWEAAGAALAMGVAWTQGVQELFKAYGLWRTGDSDATTYEILSGGMMLLSGAASAAAVFVGAAGTLTAVGATGTLASAVIGIGTSITTIFAFIPVWGWIAIGVVAMVAGIVLAWQAMTHEDTPLEVWLSRCWYRNAAEYDGKEGRGLYSDSKGDKLELDAFQQAIYGLQITFDWDDSWFASKDDLTIKVVMPGYAQDSSFAYALQARGVPSGQWITLGHEYSTFSPDPALRPHEQQSYMSAVRPGEKLIPMDEVLQVVEPLTVTFKPGVAVLKGKFAINPLYEDAARLKLQYWPNAAQYPQLMMTAGHNGVDFKQVEH